MMGGMRYRRAMERLRFLVDLCQKTTTYWSDDRLLREVYVVGDLLTGFDEIEAIDIALVVDLPRDKVRWQSPPDAASWLVRLLKLDKGGITPYWRSRDEPVWNHHIREAVRIWSLDGIDEDVLLALAERRLADLPRVTVSPDEARERAAADLDAALARLRAVRENYWGHDWRREHRGNGRYPENELWEAAAEYLDLLDATEPPR
jgi:hypothetical protein